MSLRAKAILICSIATLPVMAFVIVSLLHEIPHFFDPCFHWSYVNSSGRIAPSPECPMVAATSESFTQALTRLAFVQGGLVLAVALGIYGTLMIKPYHVFLGSLILLFQSMLLIIGSFPIPILIASALLLWSSKLLGLDTLLPRFGANIHAAIAGIALVAFLIGWALSGFDIQVLSFISAFAVMLGFIIMIAIVKIDTSDAESASIEETPPHT